MSNDHSHGDGLSATTGAYTHGHHESVLKSHTWRTIHNSAAYLEPHLSPGLSLLDVGCGPGTITAEFAERLAPGRVVGLDASAEVIAKAEALGSTAEFVVGDAYHLPFADDSFDIVHTHQTLHHLGDPVRALREWRRVAKPGGIVAAREVDYAGTFWYPQLPGLDDWLELYEQVHRSNSGDPDSGRRLRAWAHEAGFEEVTSSATLWNFTTDADREWWGSMWERRVLDSAFAGDALAKGLATMAELEAISAAWRVVGR